MSFISNIDELIKIVTYFDPVIVQIIYGVEKVLADKTNLDRFHQAANSIRHITCILTRNVRKELFLENSGNKERYEILSQLDNYFNQALDLMPVSKDKSGMDSQRNKVQNMFQELKDALEHGRLTQKQKLINYFGNKTDLAKSPQFATDEIIKIISIWKKAHDYFLDLAHYGDREIHEAEFLDNLNTLCKCTVKTVSLFIHDRPTLDEFLKLEAPPNE